MYVCIYITILNTIRRSRHTHTKVFTNRTRGERARKKWTLRLNFRCIYNMHIEYNMYVHARVQGSLYKNPLTLVVVRWLGHF